MSNLYQEAPPAPSKSDTPSQPASIPGPVPISDPNSNPPSSVPAYTAQIYNSQYQPVPQSQQPAPYSQPTPYSQPAPYSQPTPYSQVPYGQPQPPYGQPQPPYGQPQQPYPAAPYQQPPIDPKLAPQYPPYGYQGTPAPTGPVVVTLAEHKGNMQNGFWPGCAGGFFCGPLGYLVLLMFQPPPIPIGGDPRPNVAARSRQIGVYFGVATGASIVFLAWLTLMIINIAIYASYTSSSYYYYYYNPYVSYIVTSVIWAIISGVGFYLGRVRNEELKKEYNIVA